MFITRRQFLGTVGAVAGAALAPSALLASDLSLKNQSGYMITGADKGALLIDLASGESRFIDLGFEPHSYVQHPHKNTRFLAIERRAHNAAEIDFADEHVTQKFAAPDDKMFFGHGLYYKEHNAIFLSQIDIKTGKGHLIGLDPETYKHKIDYQVTPGGLHQFVILPDRTMLVSSSGIVGYADVKPYQLHRVDQTALLRVDMRNGKVIGRQSVDNENQAIHHLGISARGSIIAMCWSYENKEHGRVYYSPSINKPLRPMIWPDEEEMDLSGEMLSVAFTPDGHLAAVTNPDSNHVLLFDMETGTFVSAVEKHASGIIYDQNSKSFITSGEEFFQLSPDFSAVDEKPYEEGKHHALFDGRHAQIIERGSIDI